MPKISILAVEDDPLHADILRMVLDEAGYEVIDIVDNSNEALRLLKATQPDLLLMDIDIGEEINGIELVKKINELTDIPVIYITSMQENHVFQAAKETLPEAFIRKPYDAFQLQSAIELLIFRMQKEKNILQRWKPEDISTGSLFVKEGDSLVKFFLKDMLLVEAYDKYSYIHTPAKKTLVNITLRTMAEKLPQEQFIQVHRSYVVNLDAIEKVRIHQNSLEIAGKLVPISKTYKNLLFSRLKLL